MDPSDVCRSIPVVATLVSAPPIGGRDLNPPDPMALQGSKSPPDVLNSESGNMDAELKSDVSVFEANAPPVAAELSPRSALEGTSVVTSAVTCVAPSLGAGGGALPAPNRPAPDLDLLLGDSASFWESAAWVVLPFAPKSPLPNERLLCKSSLCELTLSGLDPNNLARGGSSSIVFPPPPPGCLFASTHPPPPSLSLEPSRRLPMLPCSPESLPPPAPKVRDPALPTEARSPPLLRAGNDDSVSGLALDEPNPRGAGGWNPA